MTARRHGYARPWARVARQRRVPRAAGIEPEFRPEDLDWLAGEVAARGTAPDLRDFPASLLVALAHASRESDRPEYGPSARGVAVLTALYLRSRGGDWVPEDEVTAAVLNAYLAVMVELMRRLGFIAAYRSVGGLFGEELRWKPRAQGLDYLEAVASYDGTVDGVRVPPHVFNRVMVHLGALTGLFDRVPRLRADLDAEWLREVQAA